MKFLQFFNHFAVEIFTALDYNNSRNDKEGPKC